MSRFLFFTILFGLSLSTIGCKKNKTKPEDSFIKIYDDQNGNKHFNPLGITTSASNDGYIVLSAYDGWRIHLMKIDNAGEFLWNYELPSQYVNAVPNLIKSNGQNYLVCMDAVGLFTYILKIDESTHTTTEVSNFPNVLYPTYAFNAGSAIYIQNYDRLSIQTGIHKLTTDLTTITQSAGLDIFTDVEERIVNHVTFNGKRIPFFVSVTPDNNHIVMNGFYNYSFSLVFLDQNLNFTGVYNGAGFNGGLAAISTSGSSGFALARFSYDNLYYNPNASLNPTTIDIAESIPAQGQSELDAQKPVLIKNISIGEVQYKAYLSSTRSNQLVLSLYHLGGSLVGKKYLGKNIPLTACDFIQTEDNGLNILVQAKIMGSFDRIAIMKLSKEQLEEIPN
ncbi:hypothetical protein [Fluviicola taffensis]|uniref:Lipoprotein n=1 Tax=Fluviicola taffensis (strain DSM 16823 / NCIMB 13979 / RW262) TaxID=755732 RepID=F2IGU5_FLUTR|nr:hypothetical protein [Fluviicola taffensis]AEA44726.1 hypothetical protein Fluta_2745 [Fluviicola taffensis DSM 16823]